MVKRRSPNGRGRGSAFGRNLRRRLFERGFEPHRTLEQFLQERGDVP